MEEEIKDVAVSLLPSTSSPERPLRPGLPSSLLLTSPFEEYFAIDLQQRLTCQACGHT